MGARNARVVKIEIRTLDTVRKQLNDQDIRIVLHATASLERSRQAILQLGAANILPKKERRLVERRFRVAVEQALERYVGGRYAVKGE